MKKAFMHSIAALIVALLSGCAGAAFNRVEMKTVRNVSIGQELQDLKDAHDKGIISDTEYAQAKSNALKLLDESASFEMD